MLDEIVSTLHLADLEAEAGNFTAVKMEGRGRGRGEEMLEPNVGADEREPFAAAFARVSEVVEVEVVEVESTEEPREIRDRALNMEGIRR